MSNPLLDAAARVAPRVGPVTSDVPRTTLRVFDEATSPARVAELELQVKDLQDEIVANRVLVRSAESIRTQRNVAVIAALALGVMWWRAR